MNRTCRLFAISTCLLILINLCPQVCNAQDDPDGDPDAPIDGGVSLLIAAGVGYGLKKANDKRKKANTANLVDEDK